MISNQNNEKYYMPLCPYLAIGNGHMLIHTDAYLVPHSLHWPQVGSPDLLGWRDPFDEWPYWQEMDEESIKFKMTYVIDQKGNRRYLNEAKQKQIEYIEDTNILSGTYVFDEECCLECTSFVHCDTDIWVRNFKTKGIKELVLQGEFCEKAVRGHPLSDTGTIDYKGAFLDGEQGVYYITCDVPISQRHGKFVFDCMTNEQFGVYFCVSEDFNSVVDISGIVEKKGFETLYNETVKNDRSWISQARQPVNSHRLIKKHYRRWLLANKLCVHKDGAVIAGPRPFWSFSWPRDSSIIAASFAVAGYQDIAEKILTWHLENTPESGIHEARYFTYNRKPVLLDNRPRQTDNPGWLLWASSLVGVDCDGDSFLQSNSGTIIKLADTLIDFREPQTGLLRAGSDHFEGPPSQSIGSCAMGLAGLLGAAKIAEKLHLEKKAYSYRQAYKELLAAIEKHLWDSENMSMRRSINPVDDSIDIAAAFMIFPGFAWSSQDARTEAVIQKLVDNLFDYDSGGMRVGAGTEVDSVWFFHTGMFLLAAARAGYSKLTQQILDRLSESVSPQGLVPEQLYNDTRNIGGCAYLCASQAFLLLYGFSKSFST